MWFQRFGFKEDPYAIRDPFKISPDFISWDREDLEDKWSLDHFIEDVIHRYRVGLKVYGGFGSGKTWLLRYLEKVLREQLGDKVVVMYGMIPRVDPTFSTLYYTLVEQWDQAREKTLLSIEERAGRDLTSWERLIEDTDLAACLYGIQYTREERQKRVCQHWLRGERIGASELRDVGILSSLERDYRKYLTLRKLLELTSRAFDTCVVVVDELENAPPASARALGDALRDLLDSFSEGFALVCSYTAKAADELLDWGYGEALFSRLEWDVRLDPITPDVGPDMFRTHHSAYREEPHAEDELFPFTEPALRKLIRSMEPEWWYPRFVFINCGVLGRAASEEGIEVIDEPFVDEQMSSRPERFQYLAPQPRLT